ncbi:uncharacterized protein [Macrobrachium rosenbergii]|uniref:uncharacterized protein isoform X4 n=1 Tax=Macrobrachium rosenbergii TaxID=79674 RepID=UPI0034D636BA
MWMFIKTEIVRSRRRRRRRRREIMAKISVFVATTVIMVLAEPPNSSHLTEIELWNNYIGLNSSYSREEIFLKQDSSTRRARNSQQAKPINITTLYANSLDYADRVLTYLESDPLQMTMEELKPHVRSLLQELDFLKVVEDFVADHLGVKTPCEAHALYNLLDLYSALEDRRQTHLQKEMIDTSWYQLRLADHPEYKLAAVQEGQRWSAVVEESSYWSAAESLTLSTSSPSVRDVWTRNSSRLREDAKSSLFLFKRVPDQYRNGEFALSVFKEPNRKLYLSIPCTSGSHGRKYHPHFGSDLKRSAKISLVRLPEGEVAIVQRMKTGLRFLHWSPDAQRYLRASCRYPGRAAHWILKDVTEGQLLT